MSNKISKAFCKYFLSILIFSTNPVNNSFAQDTLKKPVVVDNWKVYRQQVKNDSTRKMVELREIIPAIRYDLRYASLNNFMHRYMYPRGTSETYLRLPVVLALARVQGALEKKQLGLKIFDAYRPFSVTVKFWELVKDERFVANPAKGSGHNRGIAVDLTIINRTTGEELDMGTGFDNFSDTAHADFKNLPETVLKNRLLLRQLMEENGFKVLATEWWHYYFKDSGHYELLDLDFKKLRKRL